MDEEFKNWDGGWEVLRHQPFFDTDAQLKGCGRFALL